MGNKEGEVTSIGDIREKSQTSEFSTSIHTVFKLTRLGNTSRENINIWLSGFYKLENKERKNIHLKTITVKFLDFMFPYIFVCITLCPSHFNVLSFS